MTVFLISLGVIVYVFLGCIYIMLVHKVHEENYISFEPEFALTIAVWPILVILIVFYWIFNKMILLSRKIVGV